MTTHTSITPAALAARIRAADPAELTCDGEAMEIGDGYSLLLRSESDYDCSIADWETSGKLQWAPSQSQRPDGFDGSAEILDRERGEVLWWQPYREGRKVYNTNADRLYALRSVRDGFMGLLLDLHGPASGIITTHRVKEASASVWGLESWLSAEEIANVVVELLAEVADAVAP
jgi:hypothetical protein